jgi:hypothetical protein
MMNFDEGHSGPFGDPSPAAPTQPPADPMATGGIPKLAAALARAQGEIYAPLKKRKVDFTDKQGRRVHYNYADLADVIECARLALSKNELAVVHRLAYSPRGFYGMITELHHSSGEKLSTWYPLPDPVDAAIKPQEFGSALTYARRYSLSAILGIASEEDDDGAEAPPAKPQKQKAAAVVKPVDPNAPPPAEPPRAGGNPTDAQLARLFTIAGERGWSKEQIKGYLDLRWKLDSTKMLTRPQYDDFIETLETLTYEKACVAYGTGKVGGT